VPEVVALAVDLVARLVDLEAAERRQQAAMQHQEQLILAVAVAAQDLQFLVLVDLELLLFVTQSQLNLGEAHGTFCKSKQRHRRASHRRRARIF
jgi:hypothetical protein